LAGGVSKYSNTVPTLVDGIEVPVIADIVGEQARRKASRRASLISAQG